ncbi:MAG TPA: HPP family protein [Proteobacteria bacterium]|nr:HPP family protein [Pseudomonadota bacterium]
MRDGQLSYLEKMKGGGQSPPRVGIAEVVWSWIGSFLGIAAVGLLHFKVLDQTGLVMVIGSFGASAVLIYGAIKSPLAQPRNLIGGHVLSALVGVVFFRLTGQQPWLASALAVSSAIALMHLTKTLHPPGGATALIAVIGGDAIHRLGFLYALIPAASGALVMLLIALAINNLPRNRRYPEFWF